MDKRYKEDLQLEVDGQIYDIEVLEIPFREGVELRCEIEGELVRVSDRGLGIDEAKRLIEVEIRRFLSAI